METLNLSLYLGDDIGTVRKMQATLPVVSYLFKKAKQNFNANIYQC